MTADHVSRETIERLQLVADSLGMFHGFRRLWADQVANGRSLPDGLTRELLVTEQLRALSDLAYAGLEAYRTVFGNRSPHARYAFVRHERQEPGVIEHVLSAEERSRITLQLVERVLYWRAAKIPTGGYWEDRLVGAPLMAETVWVPEDRFQPLDGPNAAMWQVVEAMQSRHGMWFQMRTPFDRGDEIFWAGFTPHGMTGWNGTPDHWTGATELPVAIAYAALAALDARDEANRERDALPGETEI